MMGLNKYIVPLFAIFLLSSCNQKPTLSDFEKAVQHDNLIKLEKLLLEVNQDTLKFYNGRNLLHLAVLNDANTIAQKLIDSDVFINAIDSSGQTPFLMAVMDDNDVIANQLLAKNIDLNTIDNLNGIGALHYAIHNGNLQLTQEILKKGADINLQTNGTKNTPLHLAIYEEKPSLVKLLTERNAQDTIKNINDDTIPDAAIASENTEIIKLFFDTFTKEQKNSLLASSIRSNREFDSLGQWLNEAWSSKKNVQEFFIYVHNTTTAKKLLDYGCDINYISKKRGYGAMDQAAMRGDVAMLKFLVANGADVNQLSHINGAREKRSPLMHAAALYDDSIINLEMGNSVISLSSFLKTQWE